VVGNKFTLKLSTSIQADGSATDPYFNQVIRHVPNSPVVSWPMPCSLVFAEWRNLASVSRFKQCFSHGCCRAAVSISSKSIGSLLPVHDGLNSLDYPRLQAHKGSKTVLDQWEYVMYGKVFKLRDLGQSGVPRIEVYMSFGGLLMRMRGDPKKLEDLEVDTNLYLLMRKV
jgi:hypothetical protein